MPRGDRPSPECAAYGLAGVIQELGAAALTKYGISDSLETILLDRSSKSQTAALTAVRLFLDALGAHAMPFCQSLAVGIMAASDGPTQVRRPTPRYRGAK
jgi:hypothetical protein